MKCQCQTCKDLRHLVKRGVSEDFINRWMNECIDASVNASILEGSWPSAVEFLEKALESARKGND